MCRVATLQLELLLLKYKEMFLILVLQVGPIHRPFCGRDSGRRVVIYVVVISDLLRVTYRFTDENKSGTFSIYLESHEDSEIKQLNCVNLKYNSR